MQHACAPRHGLDHNLTILQTNCSSGPQCGNAFMRIRVAVIADIREQARLHALKKGDLDLSCNAVVAIVLMSERPSDSIT